MLEVEGSPKAEYQSSTDGLMECLSRPGEKKRLNQSMYLLFINILSLPLSTSRVDTSTPKTETTNIQQTVQNTYNNCSAFLIEMMKVLWFINVF